MWVQYKKHAENCQRPDCVKSSMFDAVTHADFCFLPRLRLLMYSLRLMLPSCLGASRPTSRATAELAPTASIPTHTDCTFSTSTETYRRGQSQSALLSPGRQNFGVNFDHTMTSSVWYQQFKDFLSISLCLSWARQCSGRRRWRCQGTCSPLFPEWLLPQWRSQGHSARSWRPWSQRWTHRL